MNRKITTLILIISTIFFTSAQDWKEPALDSKGYILRASKESTRHYVGYLYPAERTITSPNVFIKEIDGVWGVRPNFDSYRDIEIPEGGGGYLGTDFTMDTDRRGHLFVYVGGSSESRSTGSLSRYNGSGWEELGSFRDNNSSSLLANKTLSVTDSGIPYLGLPLFFNSDNSKKGDGIFKYNGTDWEEVGEENFPSGVAQNARITFDLQEIPYVAYRLDGQPVLSRLNNNLWEPVGNLEIKEVFSSIDDLRFGLSGVLYVIGNDVTTNEPSVKYFDGTNWVDTDYLGIPYEMTIDGLGKPIVSGRVNEQNTVQRFNGVEWIQLGSPDWIGSLDVDGRGNVVMVKGVKSSSGGFQTQFFEGNFVDDQIPTINCPNEINSITDIELCAAFFELEEPNATDNITNPVNIRFKAVRDDGLELTDPFSVGETLITWIAIDEAGNQSLPCEQLVTIEDGEPPTVLCGNITIELDTDGLAFISPSTFDNGSTDNCGISTIEVKPSSFSTQDLGENMVTLIVTDESGNINNCMAIVTVIEPIAKECPDSLPNEDSAIALPIGSGYMGIDEIFGTDEITNQSPCAFAIRNNDSDQPFANYRISIDLSANNIDVGDELFISLDGNSVEGTARIEVLSNNTPNQAMFSQTYPEGWTTVSTTIKVPEGLNSLDIWLYSNYLSSGPGTSYYDNLIVRNLNDSITNFPPVASGGENQTVIDNDGNGGETVTLNGSGSFDPDGSIVSYSWTYLNEIIGDKEISLVELPVGTNNLILTVTDDKGLSSTDDVVVTVVAQSENEAPVADAGLDRNITDTDGNGNEDVVLNGVNSFDSDGTIISYSWDLEGNQIAIGETPIVNLPLGTNTIVLTVTDNTGNVGSDEVVITVLESTLECPDVLVNENSSIVLPSGVGFLGIDSVVGTSENTNGSPCALIVSNIDDGQPFANYRIPINLSNYGISEGDRLFVSLDGNSSEGVARIEINQNNRPNTALASNTYNGGWSTFSATIIVPSDIVTIDIWLYSNYLSDSQGKGIYDNLIIENHGKSLDSTTRSLSSTGLTIYPNAADESINVQFKEPTQLRHFQIFDLGGKLIRTIEMDIESVSFELSVYDLPDGVYMIKAMDGKGTVYQERIAIRH